MPIFSNGKSASLVNAPIISPGRNLSFLPPSICKVTIAGEGTKFLSACGKVSSAIDCKNDLYSDNIIRGGGAYLITKDLQIDLSGLFSFKDTPSRWQIGLGASYRINSRTDKDDMLLENSSGKNKDKDRGKKSKQKRKDTDFNDGK